MWCLQQRPLLMQKNIVVMVVFFLQLDMYSFAPFRLVNCPDENPSNSFAFQHFIGKKTKQNKKTSKKKDQPQQQKKPLTVVRLVSLCEKVQVASLVYPCVCTQHTCST